MSKKHPGGIREETVVLDKNKLNLPRGVKITKPLEVTVSLVYEIGTLYSVFIESPPLIPRKRLAGMGDLKHTSEKYEDIVGRLREGDYLLESDFEVKILMDY